MRLTERPRARLLLPPSIVWQDERNAENHAEYVDFTRRATERQADRMLRIMPVFPDAPAIVVPGTPWSQERRIGFPHEYALADALRLYGPNLKQYKADSAKESAKAGAPPIAYCHQKDLTCGPDITPYLKEAVERCRKTFPKLSAERQRGSCDALTAVTVAGPGSKRTVLQGLKAWIDAQRNPKDATDEDKAFQEGRPMAAVCWDIYRLHFRDWIPALYQPTCAQGYCQDTVAVDGECSYAGSVNYVIFGVMWKLCGFREDTMLAYIWAYKGDRSGLRRPLAPTPGVKAPPEEPPGRLGASGNYEPSKAWALAGYHGWPAVANAPPDRKHRCKLRCPLPYPNVFRAPGDDDASYQRRVAEARPELAIVWQWIDAQGVARDGTL